MTDRNRKKGRRHTGVYAAAVLLILCVIYFLLRIWNGYSEEKKEEEEKELVIHVTDTGAENISAVKFNMGNGEMSFVKEDGVWYYAPDRDFPLDQSCIETIAEKAGSVTAERKLTDGDEPEAYGLTDPAYTLEYTKTDGTVTKIAFGNMTGDKYYVTAGEEGVVYTVAGAVKDEFDYTLDDIAQFDKYPSIGSGNLVKESITQNGATTTYDSANEEQEEDIAAIAGGLGAVTLSRAEDYSVDDKDLAGFGLDETSRITVEVTYTENEEEKQMKLYIGKEKEDGDRYVMLEGSRIVYLISGEICDNILNI